MLCWITLLEKEKNSYMATSQSQRRPLKSLSDNLKSKQGCLDKTFWVKELIIREEALLLLDPN